MILRFLAAILLLETIVTGGIFSVRWTLDLLERERYWSLWKQAEVERDMWRSKWEMYNTRRPIWDANKKPRYQGNGDIPALQRALR